MKVSFFFLLQKEKLVWPKRMEYIFPIFLRGETNFVKKERQPIGQLISFLSYTVYTDLTESECLNRRI